MKHRSGTRTVAFLTRRRRLQLVARFCKRADFRRVFLLSPPLIRPSLFSPRILSTLSRSRCSTGDGSARERRAKCFSHDRNFPSNYPGFLSLRAFPLPPSPLNFVLIRANRRPHWSFDCCYRSFNARTCLGDRCAAEVWNLR